MTEQDQLDRQPDAEDPQAEVPQDEVPDAEVPADGHPQAEGQDHLVDSRPERTGEQLQSALEALLLIADEPVSETDLAAALGTPADAVSEAIAGLVRFYDETGRGFELRSVAGGWRYYTREEHADLIGSYVLEGQQGKLSQAALETLAVVAYLQPVTRSRVSAVRGVNVDGVMRTLVNRDLIVETGEEESGATLFATTDYFLERMGLDSLDQLPEMAPHLPEVDDLEAELGQLAVVPERADHQQDQDEQVQDEQVQDEQVQDELDRGELDTDALDTDALDTDALDTDDEVTDDEVQEEQARGEETRQQDVYDQAVQQEEVRDERDVDHHFHPEGEADR